MHRKNFLYGTIFHSSLAEARLLHFADRGAERSERIKDIEKKITEERAAREITAGDVSDRLNTNRTNAQLVDPDRSADLLDAERKAYLLGDTPESRRYTGAMMKAKKLEEMFATHKKIEGVKYGLQGGEFTIIAADEEFVSWAIKYILAQQKELMAPPADPSVDHPYNPARESMEEYNNRMDILRRDSAQYARNLRERGLAETDEWKMVSAALFRYKSQFEGTQRAVEEIKSNPRRVNDLTDAWKKENPAKYVAILKDAAIKDATVLHGKYGKDLSSTQFLQILDEAGPEQPKVMRYYPAELKRPVKMTIINAGGGREVVQGDEHYRSLMVTYAEKDSQLLLIAAVEYDSLWRANDADYKRIVSSALSQNPEWILEPHLWKKGVPPSSAEDLLLSFNDDQKFKVLSAVSSRNAAALGVDFPLNFARALNAGEKNRTAITIVQNTYVLSLIQTRDRAFYDEIVETLFTTLSEDEQLLLQGLPVYERLRDYALHTLRLDLGASLLGDKDPRRVIRNLNADPALRNWTAVNLEWLDGIKPDGMDRQACTQWRAMIARNLYFRGEMVTKENVETENTRLIKARETYKGITLFQGRKVLIAAHSEIKKDKKPRFGTDALHKAIEAQAGKENAALVRPKNTPEELSKAKAQIIGTLVHASQPFTFVFDGHGSPDAIYLSDGEVSRDGSVNYKSTSIRITVDELANALRARGVLHPEVGDPVDPKRKDILIFSSCYNTDFIRALQARLTGYPKPITLGASEYGQYGYSDDETYGAAFFSKVLQTKDAGHAATLGDVFTHEFDGMTNPSLYVPDERNITQQVTQIREQNEGENIA